MRLLVFLISFAYFIDFNRIRLKGKVGNIGVDRKTDISRSVLERGTVVTEVGVTAHLSPKTGPGTSSARHFTFLQTSGPRATSAVLHWECHCPQGTPSDARGHLCSSGCSWHHKGGGQGCCHTPQCPGTAPHRKRPGPTHRELAQTPVPKWGSLCGEGPRKQLGGLTHSHVPAVPWLTRSWAKSSPDPRNLARPSLPAATLPWSLQGPGVPGTPLCGGGPLP